MIARSRCIACGRSSRPAEAGGRTPRDDTRIILDVTRVNMLFTVTDKKGRFITDLDKDDFEVIENKRPQTILEFTAESDLPLRLGILVDTSNSIRDRFRFEQEAAIDFVNSVIRPRQDKAMVVSFDTSAELVADLIDDPDKLDEAIRNLAPGRRHGALRRHLSTPAATSCSWTSPSTVSAAP